MPTKWVIESTTRTYQPQTLSDPLMEVNEMQTASAFRELKPYPILALFLFSLCSSTSVYYTERKPKNKKWGRPGNNLILWLNLQNFRPEIALSQACENETFLFFNGEKRSSRVLTILWTSGISMMKSIWMWTPPPYVHLVSTWCHSRDECSHAFPVFGRSSTSVCYTDTQTEEQKTGEAWEQG